jgi:hypothetical protein
MVRISPASPSLDAIAPGCDKAAVMFDSLIAGAAICRRINRPA